MSTFVLKPETEIVTTLPPAVGSKLQILAGNLWANVKRMVKDGNMEVEMTQAVAGIKGTTFVVSDDGKTSKLKVIEGLVAFTSKTDSKTTLVSTGEIITANSNGSQSKQKFDVASETKSWPIIPDVNAPVKKSESYNIIWYILVGIISILLIIAYLKFTKNKVDATPVNQDGKI